DWILGFLKDPTSPHYFGRTKLKDGEMAGWVKGARKRVKAANQEKEFDADLDEVAEWLASHPRGAPPPKKTDEAKLPPGYRVFANRCAECHSYHGKGFLGKGPDFTGYGDAEWLRLMIMAPDSDLRYGYVENNAMPAFRNLDGPLAEITRLEFSQRGTKTA